MGTLRDEAVFFSYDNMGELVFSCWVFLEFVKVNMFECHNCVDCSLCGTAILLLAPCSVGFSLGGGSILLLLAICSVGFSLGGGGIILLLALCSVGFSLGGGGILLLLALCSEDFSLGGGGIPASVMIA